MDDTTNQGMSNLSTSPIEPKPVDPIVPGGPPISLSSDPLPAQPAATTDSGLVMPISSDTPNDDGDLTAALKRIEDKLSAIALKVGA
ncbi:MAG: hypothetical protein COY68_01845 [Candidatus Levybacteria bacterium CG_4_10_14_0_8_um_filter_35_23]|nr:MAG: hypothetical protein COY68_01845 [Candidatus Levybacteria bacterium CG_4_10_14_0_8_um_filter_35_23]